MRHDGSAPIQHRILARIEAHPGGCWIWTRSISSGYARLVHQGRTRLVHRLSYQAWVGEIPDGFEIDHLCRVKACVNPAHLEAVTHAENVRRCWSALTSDEVIGGALANAHHAAETAHRTVDESVE